MANQSEEKTQQLLRAAHEVAMSKRGPTSSVHVHEAAKVMGLKVRDEDVQAELTSMIQDLQEQGDVEGWSSTNGRFRLTSQGVEKVGGSQGPALPTSAFSQRARRLSDAAYPFGHSQITPTYRLNDSSGEVVIFPDCLGSRPVLPERVID